MLNLTYGCELEIPDADKEKILSEGCSWSERELDIVNSNGLASVPGCRYGGEVNTKVTSTIEEQVSIISDVLDRFPEKTLNHRVHLHIHIGLEEHLKKDLFILKKILKYCQENHSTVIENIFKVNKHYLMTRSAWSYVIADTVNMPEYRYEFCMNANSIEEFKKSFFYNKSGKEAHITFNRYYVNVYSIFKHGTIEFRHFFPTYEIEQIRDAITYCDLFIRDCLGENLGVQNILDSKNWNFPKEPAYNHELQLGWEKTNGKVKDKPKEKKKEEIGIF